MTKATDSAVAEWTPDEQLINGAAQELQLMLETSPWHPSECLRRVFVPVLKKARAAITEADIRDAIRLAIAEDDPGDYDFEDDEGGPGLSNRDVDRLADLAAGAVVSHLEVEATK